MSETSFTEPEEIDDIEDPAPMSVEKVFESGIKNQNTKKFDTPNKQEEITPLAINAEVEQPEEEQKETERGIQQEEIKEEAPDVVSPGKYDKSYAEYILCLL